MSRQQSLLDAADGEGPRGVHAVNIVDRMQQAFLDHSMSVIVGRALPDVRDGLKPVQRGSLRHVGGGAAARPAAAQVRAPWVR